MNVLHPLIRVVFLWCLSFGALALLDLMIPYTRMGSMIGFSIAFLTLGMVICTSIAWISTRAYSRRAVLSLLVAAAAVIAAGLFAPLTMGAILVGGAWLVAGGVLGVSIGRGVHFASYLWPLVIVALGADIWSVTSPEGVTQTLIVESEAPAATIQLLMLSLVVPGTGLSPVLGIGDILFTGLLVGAARSLSLPIRRLLMGLMVGFGVCLIALLIIQLPLPALPFLGVFGVAALGSAARPKTSELLVAIGFMTVIFGLRWVLTLG